jgi:hypothetical protein
MAAIGHLAVGIWPAKDAVDVNGGLEDQAVGYSASLRFISPPAAATSASQMTIAELGLMVGAADPMMLFPADTSFTPYSVLRNISDAPMVVTPTVWWMQAGTARSATLPSLTLAPNSSERLKLRATQSSSLRELIWAETEHRRGQV